MVVVVIDAKVLGVGLVDERDEWFEVERRRKKRRTWGCVACIPPRLRNALGKKDINCVGHMNLIWLTVSLRLGK